MKLQTLATALLLAVVSVSCIKVESKKVDAPKLKKADPLTIKQLGLRCDLLGTESKEVFLVITEKGPKTNIKIHDYLEDGDRIALTGARIEGFQTISFNMEESEVEVEEGQGPRTLLVGSSILLNAHEMLVPGVTIITSKATLYLNKEYNGNIILTHTMRTETGISTKDEENPISIENCEKDEASFI